MIKVTVELVSAIHPSRSKVLGTATIANVSGSGTRANYRYEIRGQANKLMHSGLLKKMPRKQMNAWDLLALILADERKDILKRKLGL